MGKMRDVVQFYEQLDRLIADVGLKTLGDLNWKEGCPTHGVYFFFEAGEYRKDTSKDRVVRVGTHGVKVGAKTTLAKRLRQHRGNQCGGGNHRNSIFRLHLGQAICKREAIELPSWGIKAAASAEARRAEFAMEEQVTEYIRAMPFVCLRVRDEEQRKYVERNSIALLAGTDCASKTWLGLQSGNPSILKSGLWNVQHVKEECDPQFIEKFTVLVTEMTNKNDEIRDC